MSDLIFVRRGPFRVGGGEGRGGWGVESSGGKGGGGVGGGARGGGGGGVGGGGESSRLDKLHILHIVWSGRQAARAHCLPPFPTSSASAGS